jgi:predicted secreted protein
MCARTQHESRCISLSIITIVPATANAFRIIATAIFSYHVVFDIPMLYYDRMWDATYEYDNRPAKIKPTIYYTLHTSRLE